MILALALAAAEPQSAIDAERAFVADAQKMGQWTAFRKYTADEAIMFTPQAGPAKDFLRDKTDPPVAVFWWPGKSFVSCDGSYAVNTGPWVRQWGKSVGYFTTVWKRQPDGGWKWVLDHGDVLDTPRAEGGDIKPRLASCAKPVKPLIRMRLAGDGKSGGGHSEDSTLHWYWHVRADGSRTVEIIFWNGNDWESVVKDSVKAE